MRTFLLSGMLFFFAFGVVCVRAQTPEAVNGINRVIDAYLALKDALALGKGDLASEKGKALLAAVDAVPGSQLAARQQKIWQTYQPKLEFDSRHISEVNKIAHQREHFISLSANLYELLKAVRVNKTVLYEEVCTMTKHNYISQSATMPDPYMGMSDCSRVTATLPASKH